MSPITHDQIRQAFVDSRTVSRGLTYFQQQRARILASVFDGKAHTISSTVRGSDSEPYDQTFTVSSQGRSVFVDGFCSCPVGFNCKHIVAAAFAWADAAADPFAMPPDLDRWLDQFQGALRRSTEAFPPELRQRAYYVLDADGGALKVRPLSVRLGRDDRPSRDIRPIEPSQALNSTPAKYLRASDLMMLNAIAYARDGWRSDAAFVLKGEDSGHALARAVAAGRCVWKSLEAAPLRPGPERRARAEWAAEGEGALRFGLTMEEPGLVLRVSPPMYLDVAAGWIGPLVSDLSPDLTRLLLTAPAVPLQVAQDVADRLSAGLKSANLAAPLPSGGPETVRLAPRPMARLAMASIDRQPRYSYGWSARNSPERHVFPVLKPEFDYGGVVFAARDPRRAALLPGDAGRRVTRDSEAEKKWLATLEKRGLKRLETFVSHALQPEQRGWLAYGPTARPNDFAQLLLGDKALDAEGWTLFQEPGFELSLVRPDDDPWRIDLGPAETDRESGIDWFELSLGVRLDGRRVDILPVIAELISALSPADPLADLKAQIRRNSEFTTTLPDGRILVLPVERLVPMVEGLLAVWRQDEIRSAGGRLSRYEADAFGALQDVVGPVAEWTREGPIARLADALRAARSGPPTTTPDDFKATLRPYQQAGLDWLQLLRAAGFGGVLADEMGLGKTVQTLAHICVEKAAGRLDRPVLIVAPTSVLPNWRAEAERFAPHLSSLVLRGADRGSLFPHVPNSDLVITSYPLLARDRAKLVAQPYDLVVLDEGQTIRNPATAAAQAAFALDARQRLVLSGTPMENHLGDLWSLMRFLNPGLLGDSKSFVKRYRTPIEKHGDEPARARLTGRIRPFLLRRTIAEVAAELPPKSEVEERIELTPAQSELYESTRMIMDKRVREALAQRGLAQSSVVVLDALLKLRQVCCDPRLVSTASATARAGGSAKLARLIELVEELAAEDRRTLIFSQFTSMLALIDQELEARGVARVQLTGDSVDRETPVRRFQGGELGVFLISLKAGGVGLNLTRADTVILYDPWWNPAIEAQAIGRAHRIGQERPVFVHRLIAEGTIEEKMLQLQARKRELAAGLWSEDAAALTALTEDDIRHLFS